MRSQLIMMIAGVMVTTFCLNALVLGEPLWQGHNRGGPYQQRGQSTHNRDLETIWYSIGENVREVLDLVPWNLRDSEYAHLDRKALEIYTRCGPIVQLNEKFKCALEAYHEITKGLITPAVTELSTIRGEVPEDPAKLLMVRDFKARLERASEFYDIISARQPEAIDENASYVFLYRIGVEKGTKKATGETFGEEKFGNEIIELNQLREYDCNTSKFVCDLKWKWPGCPTKDSYTGFQGGILVFKSCDMMDMYLKVSNLRRK